MANKQDYDYEKVLILSGGGAFGAYHIGVLQYLEEINWKPDLICGTSVGSIVASLVCNDYSSNEIKNIFLQLKNRHFFSWKILRFIVNRIASIIRKSHALPPSLSSSLPLKKTLDKFISIEKIRTSKTKFYLSAVDVATSQLKFFSNDEITMDHIQASCAIPIVFPPVQIKKKFYWDGGIVANVPLLPIIEHKCKEIIIINLLPGTHTQKPAPLPRTLRQALIRLASEYMTYPFQMLVFLAKKERQASNQEKSDTSKQEVFPLQFQEDIWRDKDKHDLNIQILMPQSKIYSQNMLSVSNKKLANKLINEGYETAKKKLPPFLNQS